MSAKTSLVFFETEVGSATDPNELHFRSKFLPARRPARPPPLAWNEQSGLNKLLAPLSPKKFFRDVYGRSWFHFKAAERTRLDEYFSFAALGSLLARRALGLGYVAVYDRNGLLMSQEGLLSTSRHGPTFDPHRLMDAVFKQGGSLSLKHLHLFDPSVGRLANEVTAWLNHRVHINAYLTPAAGKTLGWHWDGYDVFILQTEGSKKWRIYEPLFDFASLETPHDCWLPTEWRSSKKLATITLRKGDVLYLPAGFPHNVDATRDQHSLHVTVALVAWRWREILAAAVNEALTSGIQERSLREPAWGVLDGRCSAEDRKRFQRAIGGLVAKLRDGSLEDTIQRMRASQEEVIQPEIEASWQTHVELDALSPSSYFRRTARAMTVAHMAHFIQVRMSTTVLCCTRKAAPALRFILKGEVFCLADLPGLTSLEERTELVRALVMGGALVAA